MPINLNEAQLYEEYNQLNSFELCYQGQELTQDLINKVTETVQILRHLSLYLLHGDHNSYLQRKLKLEELFSSFEIILKRLSLISQIVHNRKQLPSARKQQNGDIDDNLATSQQQQGDSELISEEEAASSEEQILLDQAASKESQAELRKQIDELKEQIKFKNSYLKLTIDKLTGIIWTINSIQTIKQ